MKVSGKVANVLSTTELAINKGADDNVVSNDIVRVVTHTPIEDPDTGEELGKVQTTLITLRVRFAAPKFAVARVIDYTAKNEQKLITENWEERGGRFVFVEIGMLVNVDEPPEAAPPPDDNLDDLPF